MARTKAYGYGMGFDRSGRLVSARRMGCLRSVVASSVAQTYPTGSTR